MMAESESKQNGEMEANSEVDTSQNQSSEPEQVGEDIVKTQLQEELQKLELEVCGLRVEVAEKEKRINDIKNELRLTRWSQLRDGIGQKYQSMQNTGVYNKLSQATVSTKQALGEAGGKTSAALQSLGTATSKKLHEIRGSSQFHSIEEKFLSTTSAVKAKVAGSKPAVGTEATEQPTYNQQDQPKNFATDQGKTY